MIANQELNKKVRALTGETTPCDVNGNPNRDYAGDEATAWELFDKIKSNDMEYEFSYVIDMGFIVECTIFCGTIVRVSECTASRAICLAYIAWKERQTA